MTVGDTVSRPNRFRPSMVSTVRRMEMARPHHARRNSGRRRRYHTELSPYRQQELLSREYERRCRSAASISLRHAPTRDSALLLIRNALLLRNSNGAKRLQIQHGKPMRATWCIVYQLVENLCHEVLRSRWVQITPHPSLPRTAVIEWGF